jgi:hypothetical protein
VNWNCSRDSKNVLPVTSSSIVVKISVNANNTTVYPKVSGLVAWSDNCKWYSSLPLGAIVSLVCELVRKLLDTPSYPAGFDIAVRNQHPIACLIKYTTRNKFLNGQLRNARFLFKPYGKSVEDSTVCQYDNGPHRCGSILLPHGTRDMASAASVRTWEDLS